MNTSIKERREEKEKKEVARGVFDITFPNCITTLIYMFTVVHQGYQLKTYVSSNDSTQNPMFPSSD
jgi:hypothetical protein